MTAHARRTLAWLACIALSACAHPAHVASPQAADTGPIEGGREFPSKWCDGPDERNHALGKLAKRPPRVPRDQAQLEDVAHTVLHDAAVALKAQAAWLSHPAKIEALLARLTALSRVDVPIRKLESETADRYHFSFLFGDEEPRVIIVCSDVGCQLGVDVVPDRVRYNYATDTSVGHLPSCDARTTRADFFDPAGNGVLENEALLHALEAH